MRTPLPVLKNGGGVKTNVIDVGVFASYLDVNTMVRGLISYIHSYFSVAGQELLTRLRQVAVDAGDCMLQWLLSLSLYIYIYTHIYIYISISIFWNFRSNHDVPPKPTWFHVVFLSSALVPWLHGLGFQPSGGDPLESYEPWLLMDSLQQCLLQLHQACRMRMWMAPVDGDSEQLKLPEFFLIFLTHFQSYVAHDDPWSMCQKNMGHFGPMTNGDQWLYLI